MLNTAGSTIGTALSISPIIVTAANILPKSRVANDKGLVNKSKTLIKKFIGDLKKYFAYPLTPLALMEAITTVTIDIRARAEVALISLVGGANPKMLIVLAKIKKAATVPK
jgi:hypothetical protein